MAAAAVLLVGGIAAGVTTRQESRVPGTVWASAGSVQMTITATARSDGTALDVTVAGLSRNEQCLLVVVDSDGRRHPAGEWAATYAGAAWFRGWTEVDRSALDEVVLLDRRGRELVRADL